MQVLPAKRRGENYTGRYSRELKSQNGKYLVNPCELNILEAQVIFPIASYL